MDKVNILYICHDSLTLGGASLSLENLISSVCDFIRPIVLIKEKGEVYDYFVNKGIDCIIADFDCTIWSKDAKLPPFYKYWHVLYVTLKNNRIKAKEICKYIDRKIDIVHSNSSVYLIGYFLSRRLHAKHIWHIRELQHYRFAPEPVVGWWLQRKIVELSDVIISISETVSKHWGVFKRKNQYIKWDAVRSKKDISYVTFKEKYFLFCANIIWEGKGPDIAIKAFALSRLFKKGYRLKMVGHLNDISYKDKLDRISKRLGVYEYVDFMGATNNIKSFMERATAFLMTSLNEGLGRVTIEAMFYGCPLIANKLEATCEFIHNGKNGFLFETIQECANMMQFVASKDVKEIILRAQKNAIENFSEEEYGKFIMKVYNKVL